jgi:hypothetical protein
MNVKKLGGFEIPTHRELAELKKMKISGQLAEALQRQEMYRESYLTRVAKQTRLNDFGKTIQKRIDLKQEEGFELFGGHFSSLAHAMAEFSLESFFYDKAVKFENRLYDALRNDGLNQEEIKGIALEGKYIRKVSKNQEK